MSTLEDLAKKDYRKSRKGLLDVKHHQGTQQIFDEHYIPYQSVRIFLANLDRHRKTSEVWRVCLVGFINLSDLSV
jgi:hypothetical protein